MSQKKIVIQCSGGARISRGVSEALRPAVGLAAGYQGHNVCVLVSDEAVYRLLESSNQPFNHAYLASAGILDVSVNVEKESLEERGLQVEQLVGDVQIVSGEEMLAKIEEADIHLRLS